jgi:hypothetical protein
MQASRQARWFERRLAELQFELWIGDAAEIRTKRIRKQNTDRRDVQLLLRLLLENRFPRIWVPSWENRGMALRGLWTEVDARCNIYSLIPAFFRRALSHGGVSYL